MARSSPQIEADTERAFLDAAEQLFAERGFEGTKVRAISDTAGTNLGALHYYWGSKEELFPSGVAPAAGYHPGETEHQIRGDAEEGR